MREKRNYRITYQCGDKEGQYCTAAENSYDAVLDFELATGHPRSCVTAVECQIGHKWVKVS